LKKLLGVLILIVSTLLLSYKTELGIDEVKLPCKIIAVFRYVIPENTPQEYFLLKDGFEYDDFWMNLAGTLADKPKVDMDHNMLMGTYGSASSIDSITETSNYINVYRKRIIKETYNSQDLNNNFILIKLKYTSKEIRLVSNMVDSIVPPRNGPF
jgi:hypothetical protein